MEPKDFKGFDNIKPTEELKHRTRRNIKESGARRIGKFAIPRWATAAVSLCLVVAISFGVLVFVNPQDYNTNSDLLNSGSPHGNESSDAYRNRPSFESDSPSFGDDSNDNDSGWSNDFSDWDMPNGGSEVPGIAPPPSAGEGTPGDSSPDSGLTETGPGTGHRPPLSTTPPTGGSTPPSQQQPPNAGRMTARHWTDNAEWSFWRNLTGGQGRFERFARHWGISLQNRIVVTVQNGQNPINGAQVALLDAQGNALWNAVTDNRGVAYVFYNAVTSNQNPARVRATFGGQTAYGNVSGDSLTLELQANSQPRPLDLMFMIDTTGSMGDELTYIQTELADIIRRVDTGTQDNPLRLSVNFYRDYGDEYVVRPFPFTTNINGAIRDLQAQYAAGGGDTPEAVHRALQNAIHEHEWRENSTRLMFLVLDAPPHDHNAHYIRRQMQEAAERGIRIITIAASGTCSSAEFLTRALAVATGGTYVHVTGHSGIGSGHTDPTIGQTEVRQLNDLIVEIIQSYMS
ncbi:MAG: VWA domain-containing protein [Oscillospiraceae bacterium]|nr:VWA domain-containing protein [Oscillospiraceae bacterium]